VERGALRRLTPPTRPRRDSRTYPGIVGGEQRELEALRRRAYGPDADIYDDAGALARLIELEDVLRLERAPRDEPAARAEEAPSPASPHPVSTPPAVVLVEDSPVRLRSPRWHTGLISATAVVAVLLGAAAWTAAQVPATADLPSAYAKTAAVANERRAAGYEASYDEYLGGLRDEVLALPGAEGMADRMIRDQLRPYGILYGRTVGAGPTVDGQFCMVIADLPSASITCISIENAYANPVSIALRAWYSDAESDAFTGLGELISYTLMPGGSVVAVPADSPGAAGSVSADSIPGLEAAAPTPTATPPPGWQ